MSRHFGKKISRIVARLRHDGHHLGINLFGFPQKFLPGHPKQAYQCMQYRHKHVLIQLVLVGLLDESKL